MTASACPGAQHRLHAAGCCPDVQRLEPLVPLNGYSLFTVHSETTAVLWFLNLFFLFVFKREVLAWGRLLANNRSSEVQVLLPR